MTELFINTDSSIIMWIQQNLRTPLINYIMVFITHLGDGGLIWIGISALFMFFSKTRKVGLMILSAVLLSFVINNVMLKNFVARLRPYDVINGLVPLINKPLDFSFPSGHTGAAFAAASVIFARCNKILGVNSLLLASAIGFSRIYVGVHYPSDVMCGMLNGIFIAIIVLIVSDIISDVLAYER